LVDSIASDRADAAVLDGIAIGLAEGARQAGVSISGGEISQLPDMVKGFDLVGTAIGTVALDRILVGRDIVPGDRVIGIASNGIHSNGFTLARRAFFERAEMYEVYNMVIGFCVILAEHDADSALAILKRQGRDARVIGYAVADRTKSVYLPQQRLIGTGKRFRAE